PYPYATPALRMYQRTGILEVLRDDRLGRPIGERADRTGGIVSRLLREGGRSHDEEVIRVPGLQIAIHDARLRIVAHDGAAGIVGRLVRHRVVIAPTQPRRTHHGWIHGARDLECDLHAIIRHFVVVLDEIIGHAEQRPAKLVFVGRVEVDVVVTV